MLIWFSGGIGVQTGRAQTMAAPTYKATFSWSLATNATVVRASTNTQVTCTVDISLTGDSYKPLPAWVMPVPSIIGAGGSTFIYTNYDYSPNWAQYVCVFTPSDPGNITLQVDAGSDSSSRAVTAVRLDAIVFSPGQVIAVSNAVTMTATVLPNTFAGTFVWTGPTNTTGTTATVTLDYGGHVPVWVTLVETGEMLSKEIVVLNPKLTVFASDNPGAVGELTGFGVLVQNDEELPHTVTWSGAVTGNDDVSTYTPAVPGTKTATATVTVGPWTGAASGDQKVFSFDITIEPDADGNVVNTYQVNGPDGVCFMASGKFSGEYDEFEQWIGVGTSVITKHTPSYDADSFADLTQDPNEAPTSPSLVWSSAAPAASSEVAPGGPEAKIRAGVREEAIEAIAKALVEVFVDEVKKLVVKSISDVAIVVPPPKTTNTYFLKAQYYPAGYDGHHDVMSDPIKAIVDCSGSTFTAKRVAAWNHLVIDGNLIVEASVSPKDVFVNHVGSTRSPNTGNIKVSACLDDPTRGGYGGISHAFAGRRSTGTAKLNTSVIIGGKSLPRTFSCFGILEFIEGTPFDTVAPPHIWEATIGDSVTTTSVNITLKPTP